MIGLRLFDGHQVWQVADVWRNVDATMTSVLLTGANGAWTVRGLSEVCRYQMVTR